jgi:hypothetical protein
MLGAYLGAEMNNFGCPWGGTAQRRRSSRPTACENQAEVGRLVELARRTRTSCSRWRWATRPRSTGPTTWCRCARWSSYVRGSRRRAAAGHLLRELRALAGQAARAGRTSSTSSRCTPTRCGSTSTSTRRWTTPRPTSPAWHAVPGQAHRHHRGRLVHQQQRPRHARRACGAGTAGHLLPGPDGLDAAGLLCFVFEAFDEPWKGSDPTRWSPRSTGACSPSTAGPSS